MYSYIYIYYAWIAEYEAIFIMFNPLLNLESELPLKYASKPIPKGGLAYNTLPSA